MAGPLAVAGTPGTFIRINFNTYDAGEEYQFRLIQEADNHFKIFLAMLSSYWQSTIDGPNYAREIKAMAIELARIRLALDDIRNDTYYQTTRTEFLYQILTSMMFPPNSEIPNPGYSDIDFRNFLIEILQVYFKGSVPASLQTIVELLTNGQIIITENFKETGKPGSRFDISDEFGLTVDVVLDSPNSTDTILADKNIRILFSIIRPAHTLYRLRFILRDEFTGQRDLTVNQPNKIVDAFEFALSSYRYEDFRKFVEGIEGIDPLGTKKAVSVVNEDHSHQF